MLIHDINAVARGNGSVTRRHFLSTVGAGALASSFVNVLRANSDDLRARGKACILLFMHGGPSQFETFNPKPGVDTGGPTKTIETSLPGYHIGADWPNIAKRVGDLAIIRSLTHRDANHPSAQFLTHTGYAASGTVSYPSVGAVVAKELGDEAFDLPNFVCIGGQTAAGSGLLNMKYAPYLVSDPSQLPFASQLPAGIEPDRLNRRLSLMDRLEEDYSDSGFRLLVEKHRAVRGTAARMTLSPRMQAFDLAEEPAAMRDRYGRTDFGQGCLLARRLIETGVAFVEVVFANWDTHRDNFTGQTTLAGTADPAFAALIDDLKARGRLDSTLVIWMGEFGRTPTINKNSGRDHYPRGCCVAMAGCGVQGGRVIGATDEQGTDVTERPVTIPDLFSTFYHALGIGLGTEYRVDGRPVPLVTNGQPVLEIFG